MNAVIKELSMQELQNINGGGKLALLKKGAQYAWKALEYIGAAETIKEAWDWLTE